MIRFKWAAFAATLLLLPVLAFAADPPPAGDNPMWQKLRVHLFGDRAIQTGDHALLELSAPARAYDAAIVPISIKAGAAQTAQRYIKTIYLILDNNPAPVAAVFYLTPASGRADIETRVRVDQYTYVRVVAETNDGALSMTTAYVKASGGCSAPASRDTGEPITTQGNMKLKIQGEPMRNQPSLAQLMIRHPNHSGLVMDQLTRLYQPPQYVRRIDVAYNGKPVIAADLDFSISENPNFRFYFTPEAKGTLTARAEDTEGLIFNAKAQVAPR